MTVLRACLLLFLLLYILPLAISALRYRLDGTTASWRTADRGSIGVLPPEAAHPAAMVRVFAAPTVSWRGIFAVHCWIVLKAEGGPYQRYDYTAWGLPIRLDGFAPDGRWFGRAPETVFAADGAAAAALIPRMRQAIADYRWRAEGDYRAWPGPNSNSFVQAVLDAVPDAGVSLPNTAIGRDHPYDGKWLHLTRSGLRITFGGYVGLRLGWIDGMELNILSAVAGFDLRRPAIKLPGLGRFGMAANAAAGAVPQARGRMPEPTSPRPAEG